MSVLPLPLPWAELSILVALVGALCVSRVRDATQAYRIGLVCTGLSFACTLVAFLGFYLCQSGGFSDDWSLQKHFLGWAYLDMDELNAPLLPMVGLLHFLTALATGRTKMRRFSSGWSLVASAIRLATFACVVPWAVITLLAVGTIPGWVELVNRRKPTRVYLVHMTLFVVFLVVGWAYADPRVNSPTVSAWGTVLLLAAVLIRCGSVPAHCWLTDWFEHASFGNALLYVTPLTGVYAAVRLVLPIAPDWALQSIGILSLITALYAASMAVVQREARRFFAYLFLSHASLVLVGLELHTPVSLTGALALWLSVALSMAGFGLTLRALEARCGRLSLAEYHGLYEHAPALAVCFLLTGLASVGFPGTLGFVATELLVEGAVQANPYVGLGVALATAINGIAVIQAYFRLFTGARHTSTVSLTVNARERFAALALAALILGGGLFPQPGIESRHRAALAILRQRGERIEPDAHPAASGVDAP